LKRKTGSDQCGTDVRCLDLIQCGMEEHGRLNEAGKSLVLRTWLWCHVGNQPWAGGVRGKQDCIESLHGGQVSCDRAWVVHVGEDN
jgi:hypothetical protein